MIVRVIYWLSKWNQPLLFNDAGYYSFQGRQLAHGVLFRELFADLPAAEHGPLTSILVAPLSFGSDPLRWQRLVTVLTGTAIVWLVGRLGQRLAGPGVGVIAATIAALSPNFWMNDGLVMSESVGMLCVAATLWFAMDASDRPTVGRFMMLGLCAGLGCLARSELAALAPLVLAIVVVARRHLGEPVHWRWLVAVGAATAVIAPWAVFNLTRFSDPSS